MDFLTLAKKRYSCRHYLEADIEKEKLDYVLEAARIAPSAANKQPWVFIVISDPDIRDLICKSYPRDWLKTAPLIVVACADHTQSWKRQKDEKDHADIDLAIAIDHLTLAASNVGLATCWICAFDADLCSEILSLPNNIEAIALIPLGYPADKPDLHRHEKQRKNISDIVRMHRYDQ
jgi:nitroreductase